MLALTAHFGGDAGLDLIAEFAANHPSDRVRWCALRAEAAAEPSLDARIAAYERGVRSSSLLVSAMAKRELARITAARGWIETPPAAEPQLSAA
jgi:hypothetical protein